MGDLNAPLSDRFVDQLLQGATPGQVESIKLAIEIKAWREFAANGFNPLYTSEKMKLDAQD